MEVLKGDLFYVEKQDMYLAQISHQILLSGLKKEDRKKTSIWDFIFKREPTVEPVATHTEPKPASIVPETLDKAKKSKLAWLTAAFNSAPKSIAAIKRRLK